MLTCNTFGFSEYVWCHNKVIIMTWVILWEIHYVIRRNMTVCIRKQHRISYHMRSWEPESTNYNTINFEKAVLFKSAHTEKSPSNCRHLLLYTILEKISMFALKMVLYTSTLQIFHQEQFFSQNHLLGFGTEALVNLNSMCTIK